MTTLPDTPELPPTDQSVPRRIAHYREALESIIRQPEETMSNGKAISAMVRIAKAALKAKPPSATSLAEAPKGWKPIETAPKDGTLILLGAPADEDWPEGRSEPGHWMEGYEDGPDVMGQDDGWTDVNFNGVFSPGRSFGNTAYRTAPRNPTHWQPLPSAPLSAPDAAPAAPKGPDLHALKTLLLELRPMTAYGVVGSRDVDQARYRKALDGALALIDAAPAASSPEAADERAPVNLHATMDALVWAKEFCRLFPGSDEGLMLSWFANAIMVGHDHAARAALASAPAGAGEGASRYRDALNLIANGPWPPDIDGPEAQCRWDASIARAALAGEPAVAADEGRDAARYRWLMKRCFVQEVYADPADYFELDFPEVRIAGYGADKNAAIDAAMASSQDEQQEKQG